MYIIPGLSNFLQKANIELMDKTRINGNILISSHASMEIKMIKCINPILGIC